MPYNLNQPNISVVTVADSVILFPIQDSEKASSLSSTVEFQDERDIQREKNLVRRLDWHIMPLYSAFYFVDYLDRSNIGNATLAGLQTDLRITSTELSTAFSAFFITYIIFKVPSNMMLHRIGPRWWLSSIMLAWGITTLCMAFTSTFSGLMLSRLVLGAAESGYMPGILYQMSRMYKPQELGLRVSILLGMAAISGIVSGPIAYGASILSERLGNLAGWQCLFLMEGVPTIVLALISYAVTFDHIRDVRWLTDEDKEIQCRRMAFIENTEVSKNLTPQTMMAVVRDIKTWLFSSVFFLNSINVTSIIIFAPILIHGFGFSTLHAELLSAPPFLAAAVWTVICGWFADRGNQRAAMVFVGGTLIGLGFFLLVVVQNLWGMYVVLFIISTGIGVQATVGVSWSAINYPDLNVRVIAVAVVTMMGNTGSIVGAFLYSASDPSEHATGNLINMACALASAVIAGATGYIMFRENRRLDRAAANRVASDSKSCSSSTKEGSFRYFY